MIINDITVRQLALLLDISIGAYILFFQLNLVIFMCAQLIPYLFSPQQKNVLISDRASSQHHSVCAQCNHCLNMDLLFQSFVQATDERMGSLRFFLPAKTAHHKVENEIHGYTFFHWKDLVYSTLCQVITTANADWYIKVLKWFITIHILHKQSHYCNGQWKLHHSDTHPQVAKCV